MSPRPLAFSNAHVAFSAYGVRIALHAEGAVLSRLLERLPPRSRPSASPLVDRHYSVVGDVRGQDPAADIALLADGVPLVRGCDIEAMCDVFEADLHLYVAEMSRHGIFVHAGAVGWRGRGIILPGKSRSGKTTMVAEFVRAGATYYSDEYAVFDRRGRVHPYPRPLSIRHARGARRRYPVEALGGRLGVRPLPVGAVVMTEYEAGASWHPRRVSPGRGALALLANTVSVRRQPAAALAALTPVVVGVPLLHGPRGEASDTVDSILQMLQWR
jgi:hypothetical protein